MHTKTYLYEIEHDDNMETQTRLRYALCMVLTETSLT